MVEQIIWRNKNLTTIDAKVFSQFKNLKTLDIQGSTTSEGFKDQISPRIDIIADFRDRPSSLYRLTSGSTPLSYLSSSSPALI